MRQFSLKEREEILRIASMCLQVGDEQPLIDFFNNAHTTKFENGKTIINKIIDKHFPDILDSFRNQLHEMMIDFIFNLEKSMEDSKEKEKILRDFGKKLVESQIDIPPEFQDIVDQKFWDLLDNYGK